MSTASDKSLQRSSDAKHTLARRKLASAGDHIAFVRPVTARWPHVLARKQVASGPHTASAQVELPEAVRGRNYECGDAVQ